MEYSEIEVHQGNDISYNNVGNIIKLEEICSNVVISIEKMLEQLPGVNRESSIYRVPKDLREMNPKAYAPQLISIGPFHHRTQHDLIVREQYKLQGFMNFLRRMNNNKMESLEEEEEEGVVKLKTILLLKDLVEKAQSWVGKVRNSYAESINMTDEYFIQMMLVDGCFIVEYFIQSYERHNPQCKSFQIQDDNSNNNVDLSFYQGTTWHILLDLTKLENQVPFFLLQSLFELIPEDGVPMISIDDAHATPISFINLTYSVLGFAGFLYKYEICDKLLTLEPAHLVEFFCFHFLPLTDPDHVNNEQYEENQWIPPSITELCEAGVIIKKAENTGCLMNVTFKNGVLEIPTLDICDEFEPIMRNLIAFEQFSTGNKNKYVIQYVSFMDDLISTEKDVRLLVNAGVIINQIGGSDKEVADLFNNLCKFVTISTNSSQFDDISKALCEHCNGWWNKSKASLKHNYFNTPWAVISFIAATFLILLTLLQTIFSAISAFPWLIS